jgi:hypothetical protein
MSVTYTIHNDDLIQQRRTCASLLTAAETAEFLTDGVIVPRYRLDSDAVTNLGEAVDQLCAARFGPAHTSGGDPQFAGQYIRDPHMQDPAILTIPLLEHRFADTVRCLLGPRILLRNSNIRRTLPGTGDATIWHTDYRPHTTPAPPLAAAPAVITMLIYLDPADADTGPLYVVPGSHTRPEQPTPSHDTVPDEAELVLEPGQVVVMNAALWHRGGPNRSPNRVRRLVTLQLCTIFMRPHSFEPSLPSPAYQRLVERAKARRDEPLLELLGLGGVNPTSASY